MGAHFHLLAARYIKWNIWQLLALHHLPKWLMSSCLASRWGTGDLQLHAVDPTHIAMLVRNHEACWGEFQDLNQAVSVSVRLYYCTTVVWYHCTIVWYCHTAPVHPSDCTTITRLLLKKVVDYWIPNWKRKAVPKKNATLLQWKVGTVQWYGMMGHEWSTAVQSNVMVLPSYCRGISGIAVWWIWWYDDVFVQWHNVLSNQQQLSVVQNWYIAFFSTRLGVNLQYL